MKEITAKSKKSQKVFRSKFDFSLPYSTYSTSWLKILRLPPEIICYQTSTTDLCNYKVDEKWKGIYIVTGGIIPVQLIESKKLSAEENIWLRGLSNDLDVEKMNRVIDETDNRVKDEIVLTYLDIIMRANPLIMKEVLKMKLPTLEEVLEETGLTAKWEARGRTEGEAKVLDLMEQGYSLDEIKSKLKLQ
jgi:hypothetical protein